MIESVFGLILYLLFSIILWVVLIPLVFVVATPIVFFFALFRRGGTFVSNLKDEYSRVWKFWKERGIPFLP
jgi:hypothetical protein